jgi:hypothetical protein
MGPPSADQLPAGSSRAAGCGSEGKGNAHCEKALEQAEQGRKSSWRKLTRSFRCPGGTVNLSGSVSRMAGGLAVGIGVYCQPMQQISAQTRNFWALEALCSAAVT